MRRWRSAAFDDIDMPVGPIDPCPNGPASFDEAQDPAAIRTVWSKLDLRLAGPSRAIASRGQAERDISGNPDDDPCRSTGGVSPNRNGPLRAFPPRWRPS